MMTTTTEAPQQAHPRCQPPVSRAGAMPLQARPRCRHPASRAGETPAAGGSRAGAPRRTAHRATHRRRRDRKAAAARGGVSGGRPRVQAGQAPEPAGTARATHHPARRGPGARRRARTQRAARMLQQARVRAQDRSRRGRGGRCEWAPGVGAALSAGQWLRGTCSPAVRPVPPPMMPTAARGRGARPTTCMPCASRAELTHPGVRARPVCTPCAARRRAPRRAPSRHSS